MDNNKLFGICLFFSLMGLLILGLYCENLKFKEYSIKDINSKMIDQKVRISGIINRITETQGLYLLDVKDDSGKITILIFKKEPLILQKNSPIEVSGIVSEYEDQTEIIAKKVKT